MITILVINFILLILYTKLWHSQGVVEKRHLLFFHVGWIGLHVMVGTYLLLDLAEASPLVSFSSMYDADNIQFYTAMVVYGCGLSNFIFSLILWITSRNRSARFFFRF